MFQQQLLFIGIAMKYDKLLAGLKALCLGSSQYEYKYSATHIYSCSIRQLFQPELQKKYPQITLEKIAKQFAQYMCLPPELLGKRSSQITISANRRYCFKLLDDESLRKLMEIFQDLLAFITENEESCILPIFRIFVVQSSRDHYQQADNFLLMPCLRPNFDELLSLYDLKGHTEARSLPVEDFQIFKFGKDENFVQSKQMELIKEISLEAREKFVAILTKDVKYLLSKSVLDYSLLLSFRVMKANSIQPYKNCLVIRDNIVMEWALIDYFQEYTQKKKAENKFKSLFRKEVSSAEPQYYAERIINFVNKYFLF